jgi:hypothetical protein
MKPSARRGQASIIAALTLFVIGSLAGVILSVSHRHAGEIRGSVATNRAFQAALAGANEALAAFDGEALTLGSAEAPIECGGATYWSEVEDLGGGAFVVRAHGFADRVERVLEVELEGEERKLFDASVEHVRRLVAEIQL